MFVHLFEGAYLQNYWFNKKKLCQRQTALIIIEAGYRIYKNLQT